MKKFGNTLTHEWKFDLPWEMARLRDWFYMVNHGYIYPTVFLHVRVLGLRSLWTYESLPTENELISQPASADALDDICVLLDAPNWEYPGQVVRDVAKAIGMDLEVMAKKLKDAKQ